MDTTHEGNASAGQGTVEYLGVVLAVALMLAVSAIVIGRLRPDAPSGAMSDIGDRVALVELLGPQRRDTRGWLRRAAGRAVHIGVTIVRGRDAMTRGFVDALVRDAKDLAHDPVGTLLGRPGDGLGLVTAALHPIATGRAQVRVLRRYVGTLRSMDADDAYVRLMYDLGGVAEDGVLSHGRRTIVKRMVDTGRRMRRRTAPTFPSSDSGSRKSHN